MPTGGLIRMALPSRNNRQVNSGEFLRAIGQCLADRFQDGTQPLEAQSIFGILL